MNGTSERVATSSPLSSLDADTSTATIKPSSSQPAKQYRQAIPFSRDLSEQLQVPLDVDLFLAAIDTISAAVTSSVHNKDRPIMIPPPDFLALIFNITIHPAFTTRCKGPDLQAQANMGFNLLRTILKLVGPLQCRMNEAFCFERTASRAKSEDDSFQQPLTTPYANESSIFHIAQDFWSVVGWAFNCSTLGGLYAQRWQYWKPWLQFVISILEEDWLLRRDDHTYTQSLLWQYIEQVDGSTNKARRMIRAVFADGSKSSLKEFGEIFPKEMKLVKEKQALDQFKGNVDIDQGIYGDWLDDSESASDEQDDGRRRATKRRRVQSASKTRKTKSGLIVRIEGEESDNSAMSDGTPELGFGDQDSVNLRLRLLQLLANFAGQPAQGQDKHENFPDPHEIFTNFVESIRNLPLEQFEQIIWPSDCPDIERSFRIALYEFILQRVIDNENSSKMSTFEPMTKTRLLKECLPFAARQRSIVFQAKASILVESMLRQLDQVEGFFSSGYSELVEAAMAGVDAREAKVRELQGGISRKHTNEEEESARAVLEESSVRIKYLVKCVIPAT